MRLICRLIKHLPVMQDTFQSILHMWPMYYGTPRLWHRDLNLPYKEVAIALRSNTVLEWLKPSNLHGGNEVTRVGLSILAFRLRK